MRVSVSEAARLFGVSSRTIRRAIKDGLLNYIVVQGRYKISFDSLVSWSQESTRIRQKRDKDGIGQYVGSWKIQNTLYSPRKESTKPSPDAPVQNREREDQTQVQSPSEPQSSADRDLLQS